MSKSDSYDLEEKFWFVNGGLITSTPPSGEFFNLTKALKEALKGRDALAFKFLILTVESSGKRWEYLYYKDNLNLLFICE